MRIAFTAARPRRREEAGFQAVVAAALIVVLVAVLFPLWRVVMTSVTRLDDFMGGGVPLVLPPWSWSLVAYEQLIGHPQLLVAGWNSLVITLGGVAIALVLTTTLAYALATRSLPGRNVIITLVLFTFLFHPGLVPNYLLITRLGLANSYLAVIVPLAVSVYNTLVMKTFFEGIPDSLKEAARIDGANDLQILWRIMLPLSRPILLTIGLFYGVMYWNEFFSPILYLNDASLQPLPVLLRNILSSASVSEYVEANAYSQAPVDALKAASVVLTTLPMLVVYPWIQRYFTKGTLVGAVKE